MLEYFENRAGTYQAKSERGLWNWLRRREMRAAISLLAPSRDESLIDFGCGGGFYAAPLQFQYGMRVVGIDSSPAMIRTMAGVNITAFLMDAEEVSGLGPFDKALAAGVLEFLPRPKRFFSGCRDLLKPGGRLVILIPTKGFRGWLYKSIHQVQGCPTYIRSLSEYIRSAEAAGFALRGTISCTPISLAASFDLK